MTKKIELVCVTLFLLSLSVYSQVEWFPLEAEWCYESGNSLTPNPVNSYHFVVEKDTVIEGRTCKLISGKDTKNAVYEENGSVYYYFNDKFRKIYDFLVEVGDVIDLEFKVFSFRLEFDTTAIVPCRVDKVISKFVNGVELKEVHASYSVDIELSPDSRVCQSGRFVYLEKIGCERPGLKGGEFIPHLGVLTQVPEYYYELKNYHDTNADYTSNAPLYKSNAAIKIYPDPVNDELVVNTELYGSYDISVFNMQGVLVAQQLKNQENVKVSMKGLPKGVYVVSVSFEGRTYSYKVNKN